MLLDTEWLENFDYEIVRNSENIILGAGKKRMKRGPSNEKLIDRSNEKSVRRWNKAKQIEEIGLSVLLKRLLDDPFLRESKTHDAVHRVQCWRLQYVKW